MSLTVRFVSFGRLNAGLIPLLVLSLIPGGTTKAQDANSQPIFEPVPGAIVSGLSGLVAGTKDAIATERDADRIAYVRRALTDQLLTMTDPSKKLSLGALKDSDYQLSNEAILCRSRGDHAVVVADAAYLETATGALSRFATPPKINTIGDALGTLFQNYSIEVPKGKTKAETAKLVIDRCVNDTKTWASFSYGRTLEGAPSGASAPIPDIGSIGSAVTTLYNAILAIIQPIAVGAAKAVDARERAKTITKTIKNEKDNLIAAAQSIADKGSRLARKKRLDALGQFSERMATLRSVQIDLSKVDNCQSIVSSPVLPLAAGASATPNRIPTDGFILCYAAAWRQISEATENAVTAAHLYDSFADASDDKLQLAVQQIKANIAQIENPTPDQQKAIWEAATQLIAFGQTVSQSLSKENVEKANKAIADLMKLFQSKE